MAVRLNNPWRAANEEEIARLPGQLGVFELGDDDEEIIFIGCADGRSLFGLRSAVADALRETGEASRFRIEVTTAYRSRHLELLMVFQADHDTLPRCNQSTQLPPLGRLSPS